MRIIVTITVWCALVCVSSIPAQAKKQAPETAHAHRVQEIAGVFCKSRVWARFFANYLRKDAGLRGIRRLHVMLALHRGFAERQSSAKRPYEFDSTWCSWEIRPVFRSRHIDSPHAAGTVFKVRPAVQRYNSQRWFFEDGPLFFITGTAVVPDEGLHAIEEKFKFEIEKWRPKGASID